MDTRKLASVAVDDLLSRMVYDIIGQTAFSHDFKCLEHLEVFHAPYRAYRNAFEPAVATRTRVILALVFATWIVDRLPRGSIGQQSLQSTRPEPKV